MGIISNSSYQTYTFEIFNYPFLHHPVIVPFHDNGSSCACFQKSHYTNFSFSLFQLIHLQICLWYLLPTYKDSFYLNFTSKCLSIIGNFLYHNLFIHSLHIKYLYFFKYKFGYFVGRVIFHFNWETDVCFCYWKTYRYV